MNPVDSQTYPNCTTYNILQPGSTPNYVAWTEYYQNINIATNASCTGITVTCPRLLVQG